MYDFSIVLISVDVLPQTTFILLRDYVVERMGCI